MNRYTMDYALLCACMSYEGRYAGEVEGFHISLLIDFICTSIIKCVLPNETLFGVSVCVRGARRLLPLCLMVDGVVGYVCVQLTKLI